MEETALTQRLLDARIFVLLKAESLRKICTYLLVLSIQS